MTDRNPHPFRLAATNDGGWYWRLVAANGETLAHSEVYTTKAAALKGIASAVKNISAALHLVTPANLSVAVLNSEILARQLHLEEVDGG